MARVTKEQQERLEAFLDSLPEEAQNKCALCRETLVHIVKKAEVESGAGTATVTRVLSERINKDAAPADRVSSEQLRGRVQREDGTICMKRANKTQKPLPEPDRKRIEKAYKDLKNNQILKDQVSAAIKIIESIPYYEKESLEEIERIGAAYHAKKQKIVKFMAEETVPFTN